MLFIINLAVILLLVITGVGKFISYFSSTPTGSSRPLKDWERRLLDKEDMTDIDSATGDYTSKYDGSRRTKDGCLIHW